MVTNIDMQKWALVPQLSSIVTSFLEIWGDHPVAQKIIHIRTGWEVGDFEFLTSDYMVLCLSASGEWTVRFEDLIEDHEDLLDFTTIVELSHHIWVKEGCLCDGCGTTMPADSWAHTCTACLTDTYTVAPGEFDPFAD